MFITVAKIYWQLQILTELKQQELSFIMNENSNGTEAPLEDSLAISYENKHVSTM